MRAVHVRHPPQGASRKTEPSIRQYLYLTPFCILSPAQTLLALFPTLTPPLLHTLRRPLQIASFPVPRPPSSCSARCRALLPNYRTAL